MTPFEQYFLLIFCSWGIFLVFAVLHTAYRLLKKLWQKPKITEVSPAEMLQMPFTAVEFKSSQSIALLQFISAVVVLTAIFIFYKSLFPIEKAFGGKSPFSLSNLTESSRNGLMWATVVLFTWWGVFKFSFGGTKYHVLEEGFTPKNADGKARRSYPMLIPWETKKSQ